MDEDGEVRRFAYDGWDIRISVDATMLDGQAAGHADLWLGGEHKCRIALSGRFVDPATACDALAGKAKAWIDDWKVRLHSGDTGFAEL